MIWQRIIAKQESNGHTIEVLACGHIGVIYPGKPIDAVVQRVCVECEACKRRREKK